MHELGEDCGTRRKQRLEKPLVSSESKSYLNSLLHQLPAQSSLADLKKDSAFCGKVLAWCLLELDTSVDTLISKKSIERKILLEHFWFEPLIHMKALRVVPFQNAQGVVHTGARNWPASKIFEMHPDHVPWLLGQHVKGEEIRLEEKLVAMGLFPFASTTTSVQIWGPVAHLTSAERWCDVSLPAFFQWSAGCTALLTGETKQVLESARNAALTLRLNSVDKPRTAGIEMLNPSGFNQLADDIAAWGSMLLDKEEFSEDAERCRLEIAIQTCRSQAALLEDIAAGCALESQSGGRGRYNIVFLLQTLWLAFDLKSDAVLRNALLHAVKVLFPKTRHGFLEQIISDESMPLPSRSILTQARFFLDLAFMKRVRQENALRYPIGQECGALHILVDSSPQGGFNWLIVQMLWIGGGDLRKATADANRLVRHAQQLRALTEQGFPLPEEDVETETALVKSVSGCIHRHPCPPVGLGRGDLLHELHALYHCMFLETGDPKLLAWMTSCVCAITSDRGVEAGYPKAPAFAFHDMFPYFVPPPPMQPDGNGFESLDDQPDQAEVEAESHRLCLQGALPVPGCLHIVHNATRHMLSAMPHFEQRARPGFTALVDFLHKNFTRQRFVATCLNPFPEAQVFAPLFGSFAHTLVKWRFGTLAAVCKDLVGLEIPLRRFWNADRLNFQRPQRQNEEAPRAPDGAFGDNRLEGPNIAKAGEAVQSSTFWSWVHMICSLAGVIGHIESWFESCPCHSDLAGRERLRAFGGTLCPLRNFRAPELASQSFIPFLERLANLSAAEVVFKHTRYCKDEDRIWILEDFEAGRQHLQFSFVMQTSCWTNLPHRLCCLGHFDESIARSESAQCLRLWIGMSDQERAGAHPWSKALLGTGDLGQQFRAFIRGTPLLECEKLDRVASKFKFIPLSEKPIEGRHAIIHKTLKQASNSGPVFLSMSERMPVLMRLSTQDMTLFEDFAKTADSLYHPLQAAVSMGFSNHPDLAPLVANVFQQGRDRHSCMVWGATHKHSKPVKKVVYHVDSTAQFMDLAHIPAMDDGLPNPSAHKGQSSLSQSTFSFEERAAFQKLLDVHEPGNTYTLDRSASFAVRSLTSVVQGHSKVEKPMPGETNLEDADMLFDFEEDGGVLSAAQPGPPEGPANAPLAFHILSLRPTRLKLPEVDKNMTLAWTDIAVSILPVHEAEDLATPNASIVVGCCPDAPCADTVSVLSRGGFATLSIWEKEPKLHCRFDSAITTDQDQDFAEDLAELADALVKASAFPNTVTGLLDNSLADHQKKCLEHLETRGFVVKSSSGLWQLTPTGVTSFRISFRLQKPRSLVDLELDVPLVERSESALLLALRKADWQLFQWRKTKSNPLPEPYPFDFPAHKPPKKYFYVNTGRQSVGHSYLAVLVGLSDSELVSFFKRQGVFAVKHLQSDQSIPNFCLVV